jgi:hypothetical protein
VSEHRSGSGGVEDNVRDEMDEASSHGRRDASREAVEAEERTGGAGSSGGVEDNVRDEMDEASSHGSHGREEVVREDTGHERSGSGRPAGTQHNVRDDLDEASARGSHDRGDVGAEVVEDNEPQGVKDAVADEFHEAQRRSDDH